MMKAITEMQPYGTLIIDGYKHYETHSRKTNIRGRVAIHAAKKHNIPHSVFEKIARALRIPDNKYVGSWLYYLELNYPPIYFGAVLGTVEILDCIPVEQIRDKLSPAELAMGDYSDGRYAYKLACPIKFAEPIPAKGSQGWWNWDGGA
ncbi:hypothetical protein [Acetanaerobacterium elongatum]|uniref:ASCH domain-containing protein n=1 Tax=Acetanaerobacterium elongatum TaxID=258515 RepID=A0A1G9Z1Y7_9FIRM|nr:hypothetical protein [Acetanaerobacterium elongatum]SDN14666.1 hypothetical protein SAMN05192585_11243 [Acetanaerobacterium elongatum]